MVFLGARARVGRQKCATLSWVFRHFSRYILILIFSSGDLWKLRGSRVLIVEYRTCTVLYKMSTFVAKRLPGPSTKKKNCLKIRIVLKCISKIFFFDFFYYWYGDNYAKNEIFVENQTFLRYLNYGFLFGKFRHENSLKRLKNHESYTFFLNITISTVTSHHYWFSRNKKQKKKKNMDILRYTPLKLISVLKISDYLKYI